MLVGLACHWVQNTSRLPASRELKLKTTLPSRVASWLGDGSAVLNWNPSHQPGVSTSLGVLIARWASIVNRTWNSRPPRRCSGPRRDMVAAGPLALRVVEACPKRLSSAATAIASRSVSRARRTHGWYSRPSRSLSRARSRPWGGSGRLVLESDTAPREARPGGGRSDALQRDAHMSNPATAAELFREAMA